MDFKAEANKVLADVLSLHHGYCTGLAAGVLADALRRAYEAGAADALVRKLDAIAGDDWAPAVQEGA